MSHTHMRTCMHATTPKKRHTHTDRRAFVCFKKDESDSVVVTYSTTHTLYVHRIDRRSAIVSVSYDAMQQATFFHSRVESA